MRKPFETANCTNYALLKQFAKEHRSNPTEAECCLWRYLSNDNLGVRFRRQYIIGDYIADFVCLKKRLIVEVDGGYHDYREQQQEDEIRTKALESLGYEVIRFTNEQVLLDTEKVIEKITIHLLSR